MKLWYCIDFTGFWPVGAAAIVVAKTEESAREIMDQALKNEGLAGIGDAHLIEVDLTAENAVILNNGEY